MKKSILLSFCPIIISFSNFAQIGIFEKTKDIGKPKLKGSGTYDVTTQSYFERRG